MDGSRNAGFSNNAGTTGGLTGQQRMAGTTGGLTGQQRMAGTAGTTNAGPHSSNVANKLDPRVDSDMDGSRNAGFSNNAGTTGGLTGQQRMAGNAGGFTGVGNNGPAATTAGPHRADMLNKVDPRVDSDADGRTNMGLASHGPGGANSAASGPASATAGPHRSNVANKVDPSVDSDADGSRNMGMAAHGPGGHHHHNQQHHGHHGAAGTTGATGGGLVGGVMGGGPNSMATGPAPHTAGPHKLDILNKLDPRVDSNMDGSATIGDTGPASNTRSAAPVRNTGTVNNGPNRPLV
jgi:hypothetical protein